MKSSNPLAFRDLQPLTPACPQSPVRKLYNKAWDAYVEADMPFGETDEAMLIWFTFAQATRSN